MTRLIYSSTAASDLDRLADFLLEHFPEESEKTIEIVVGGLEILKSHPEIGRRVRGGLRELVISRGRTGYLALYVYDAEVDLVTVLAVRHQHEAGYRSGS